MLHAIKKRKESIAAPDLTSFLPLTIKRKHNPVNRNNFVEKALISRLIGGDESAFSILFSAYYRDLVLFAFSFTKNCDDAEEIAQDTFVKLWEDHKNLVVDNSLKSYLLKTQT